MKDRKKNIKQQNIVQLVLLLFIIILINIISSFIFTRFDLTSEKRYTLSPATKHILKNIDDIVFFQVYLEGDFPMKYKRLRNETKEMLDEFRAYSDNIQYEFINPSESSDIQTRRNVYKILVSKGLEVYDSWIENKDKKTENPVFPGAIVTYKQKELPLKLLSPEVNYSEDPINNAIENLEYNLADFIKRLTIREKPKIAFIEGHGELNKDDVADITKELSEHYDIERIKIDGQINSLTEHKELQSDKIKIANKYDAIIIAKPDSAFSEKDKFIIDQFIMRGGKVLWIIDPVYANMDSLRISPQTVGIALPLNLDDQLFKYGVRLNSNLIMDCKNALPIPAPVAQTGGKTKLGFKPWFYSPVIIPSAKHPIVKNLNPIKTEFVSSIDTVGAKNIRKTILLTSSDYSRTVNTPAIISIDILDRKIDERMFNNPFQSVAVLLEGEFESVFKNRMTSEIIDNKLIGFKESSGPNKMLVISDGDIIRNQFQNVNGVVTPLPLGYDKWTRETFGNKEFIINAINYLCDNTGLILARSKEIKIRLLDKQKIEKNKLSWQLLNTILPILLVVIFGIVQSLIRKRKYS